MALSYLLMEDNLFLEALGIEWLEKPSQKVHRLLEDGAKNTAEGLLQWHAVTPDMASMKLQSPDVIKPLPKIKTVKSFFAPSKSVTTNQNQKSATTDKNSTLQSHNATLSSTSLTTSALQAPVAHMNQSIDSKRQTVMDNSSPTNQKASKKAKPSPSPGRGIDFFFKPKKI